MTEYIVHHGAPVLNDQQLRTDNLFRLNESGDKLGQTVEHATRNPLTLGYRFGERIPTQIGLRIFLQGCLVDSFGSGFTTNSNNKSQQSYGWGFHATDHTHAKRLASMVGQM